MSIKSDKWIKKMSLEEKMIEPFSENQVRVDEDGNKLISTKLPEWRPIPLNDILFLIVFWFKIDIRNFIEN